MAVTLTVDNFVREIKNMDARARGKLRTEDLVNLIVQVPDRDDQSPKIDEMMRIVTDLQNSVIANSQEILKIKVENQVLREEKIAMTTQIDSLLEDEHSKVRCRRYRAIQSNQQHRNRWSRKETPPRRN